MRRSGPGGGSCSCSSRSRARSRQSATRASTTSPCSSPSGPTWPAGSRTPRATAWPLTGLSDHFVSEALYLSDPDAHGIEIYWDRAKSVWEGQVDMRLTTQPLDVQDLLAELEDPAAEPFDGLPSGTTMGHVHLKVSTIPETLAFYRDRLGFALMASFRDQAAFLAAGGYHHHLGANTWESAGAPSPPAGTAALRQATIVLPDEAERERVLARLGGDGDDATVVDPSGNRLVLAVADA